MLYDSIQLLEGSKLTNIVVDSGTSFPQTPTEGELFYKTDDDKLYAYNGSAWVNSAGEILPTQTGNSGKYLTTNGSTTSWVTVSVPVTSIAGTANQITAADNAGAVTLSLPSSVQIAGTFTGATLALSSNGDISSASLTTSATTANQVVDTAAIATFRAVKYLITVTSGAAYQLTEVYVIHDGSTVFINEIGTMKTGASLATFDSDISGGNMRLLVTPANASTTVKVVRMAVKV